MMADYVMVYNLTLEMTDEERETAIEKAFVRARSIIAQNADEVANDREKLRPCRPLVPTSLSQVAAIANPPR